MFSFPAEAAWAALIGFVAAGVMSATFIGNPMSAVRRDRFGLPVVSVTELDEPGLSKSILISNEAPNIEIDVGVSTAEYLWRQSFGANRHFSLDRNYVRSSYGFSDREVVTLAALVPIDIEPPAYVAGWQVTGVPYSDKPMNIGALFTDRMNPPRFYCQVGSVEDARVGLLSLGGAFGADPQLEGCRNQPSSYKDQQAGESPYDQALVVVHEKPNRSRQSGNRASKCFAYVFSGRALCLCCVMARLLFMFDAA
jgi:hypothetical protein